MTAKYNIFIEGIPGSGKTTLLNALAEKLTDYHVYHEGDISPLELAWCTYMNESQYNKALLDMPEFCKEMKAKTIVKNNHFITAYTKIYTEKYEFYQYMGQYEIYGGRKSTAEFKEIIKNQFAEFNSCENLFECSFFQNIIEELMLFAMFDTRQIVDFYKELISMLDLSKIKLIRLRVTDMEASIMKIKSERVDHEGNESWYPMMMDYLKDSPYGKAHGISDFDDMVNHFKRRILLEDEVMHLLLDGCYIDITSKDYDLAAILGDIRK